MKVVHTSTALSKKHTHDNDEDVNWNVEATYPNITLLVINRPSLPIIVIYSHDQGQNNDCVKDVGTFMLLKSLSHSAKSNALCYNIVTGKDGNLQSKRICRASSSDGSRTVGRRVPISSFSAAEYGARAAAGTAARAPAALARRPAQNRQSRLNFERENGRRSRRLRQRRRHAPFAADGEVVANAAVA